MSILDEKVFYIETRVHVSDNLFNPVSDSSYGLNLCINLDQHNSLKISEELKTEYYANQIAIAIKEKLVEKLPNVVRTLNCQYQ